MAIAGLNNNERALYRKLINISLSFYDVIHASRDSSFSVCGYQIAEEEDKQAFCLSSYKQTSKNIATFQEEYEQFPNHRKRFCKQCLAHPDFALLLLATV